MNLHPLFDTFSLEIISHRMCCSETYPLLRFAFQGMQITSAMEDLPILLQLMEFIIADLPEEGMESDKDSIKKMQTALNEKVKRFMLASVSVPSVGSDFTTDHIIILILKIAFYTVFPLNDLDPVNYARSRANIVASLNVSSVGLLSYFNIAVLDLPLGFHETKTDMVTLLYALVKKTNLKSTDRLQGVSDKYNTAVSLKRALKGLELMNVTFAKRTAKVLKS